MSLDVHLLPIERVAALAERAGLVVDATLVRDLDGTGAPQGCLLVRKRSRG
ncbi:hypothetical protein ACIQ7D_27890 [Streptomyces sp. NPDC096310]|uniref:hypothetical protein n=1 Tax=Streptomyces sp. NPDC096310 TaxID=3366082 RepID=UPI0037F597FE